MSIITNKISQIFSRTICSKLSEIMGKTAVVILAPGAEEMEFVISVDVLRRAGVS